MGCEQRSFQVISCQTMLESYNSVKTGVFEETPFSKKNSFYNKCVSRFRVNELLLNSPRGELLFLMVEAVSQKFRELF